MRLEAARRGLLDGMGRGLGWFSLALGAGLLAAPRTITRLSGVEDSAIAPVLVRIIGARQVGHAAILLGGRHPDPWTWTRVAGDAMDLAALGMAMTSRHGVRRLRTAVTAGTIAGLAAVDILVAVAGTRHARKGPMRLHSSVTVNRPREEVYRFWHDFGNLPRFMFHLESVESDGDGRRSHWKAKAPAGRTVEWDAEVVEDAPNQMIAWRSLPGAKVPNRGRVRFMPAGGGRGTEVRVELEYLPPGGAAGRLIAMLFGEEPRQQVADDLRRFKQVVETGEVVRSEGSPDSLSLRHRVMQRPARPARQEGPR
jgi:uncharacterized membrane protein